ncbi:phage tail protein [Lactiplantibacillus plantarum]|uniref:phage tail protein n=1 Tax=Lactiplantibacillus plantarum TaxID=1590 RepID=UPI001B332AC1|nr:phage tail protein [Lactiplantibacillus plantarum]MBP5818566.1 phage tail protein [Lactiplantibacillus plantarum]
MIQYPKLTISDRLNQQCERLPLADLQETFKESWTVNEKWQVTFAITDSLAYEQAIQLLDVQNIIQYDGQSYVITQCTKTVSSGLSVYEVTASHLFYRLANNVRQNNVKTGTLTYGLADAVNFMLDSNDQGITANFIGDFPKIQIENLGNSSFSKFLQDYTSKFDASYTIDNQQITFYSATYLKQQPVIDTLFYQHDVEDVKLSLDTTSLVNEVRCLGKPIDQGSSTNSSQTKYQVDFIYRDDDSVKKWGLQRGDPLSDDRFTDQESMTEYARQTVQAQPIATLTTTAWNVIIRQCETVKLIMPNLDWQTTIALNGYERNPFNQFSLPTITFDNASLAVNDINVAMFKHITNAHNNVGKTINQFQAALDELQDGDLITDDDTIDKLNELGEIS